MKAQGRSSREEALQRVSRIGQDLTSVHDRKQLLERAVSSLIHDLAYEGASVIMKTRRRLQRRTSDQVLVPVQFQREVLGAIVIPVTGRRITDTNREILDIFAEFLAIGLNNVRCIEEARELAFVDSLTGVMNRRYLLEVFPPALAQTKSSIALVAFDIDAFKAINDAYGHPAGDAVLRFVADQAKKCLRQTDLLIRYGGDEFVILLPHTRLESARNIAGRIRTNIEGSPVRIKTGSVYCTISVGIASFTGAVGLTSLMNRADQALYAAKHGGRNMVCSA